MIARGSVLSRGGSAFGGRGAAGVRVALEIVNARFEFVDDAQVVDGAYDLGVGVIEAALDAGGGEVAGLELGDANSGEVEGERDGEEGHRGGHGESRLHQGVADGLETEGSGDALRERENLGRDVRSRGDSGCGWNKHRSAEQGVCLKRGDRRQVGCRAGGGEDTLEQHCGRLGPGAAKHLEPGGSALGVDEHTRAVGAGGEVAIEDGLLVGREGLVEDVGQHGLALSAVFRVRRP